MPTIDADGCPLNISVEGPENAPTLMLCNSLGTDLHMWDDQTPIWSKNFRLIRYDRRGHGKSGVPKGPYSMERLGRDALAIMDKLGVKRTNWCGLSLGGMVGMWLGANAPDRFERIIISNTVPYYAVKDTWNDRIKIIRDKGLAPIVDANLERWFSKEFRERAPQAIARMRDMFLATPVDGYVACCEAIRDMDHRDLLAKITAPTLVIAGSRDPATSVKDAEFIQSRIPDAMMTVIEAAHISNVEQPAAYGKAVVDFLRPN
jgi:3-oxoadipate enol-lactonase